MAVVRICLETTQKFLRFQLQLGSQGDEFSSGRPSGHWFSVDIPRTLREKDPMLTTLTQVYSIVQ